jgi:hypothetical protein
MRWARAQKQFALLAALAWLAIWLSVSVDQQGRPGLAVATAESLNVDNLPKDPKEFRKQVEQILIKGDRLVEKLKATKTPQAVAAVLDLMQTLDNVRREIVKLDKFDGAKWTEKEARGSVEAMLQLLKGQYEKASELGG